MFHISVRHSTAIQYGNIVMGTLFILNTYKCFETRDAEDPIYKSTSCLCFFFMN